MMRVGKTVRSTHTNVFSMRLTKKAEIIQAVGKNNIKKHEFGTIFIWQTCVIYRRFIKSNIYRV